MLKNIYGDFMDVNFELGDLKFVWDSEKSTINRKKHGISFETASRVFLDENYYDTYDKNHSEGEDRFKIIGRVGKILTVIYTEREDRTRIISARQADKNEEAEYYEQFYW